MALLYGSELKELQQPRVTRSPRCRAEQSCRRAGQCVAAVQLSAEESSSSSGPCLTWRPSRRSSQRRIVALACSRCDRRCRETSRRVGEVYRANTANTLSVNNNNNKTSKYPILLPVFALIGLELRCDFSKLNNLNT